MKKVNNYIIRNIEEIDYREIEEMTKLAFWNMHSPGCDEHYLVHVMRQHEDFIPELSFIIEEEGKIVANIMYVKAWLIDSEQKEKEILSFGPLTVHPDYQRKGYGKALLDHSFEIARKMGYEAIGIFGHPSNYISSGFKSGKRYNVHMSDGCFPAAFLVKELVEGALKDKDWTFRGSKAYDFLETDFFEFDKTFPQMEKAYQFSQEEFYIYSHSQITW